MDYPGRVLRTLPSYFLRTLHEDPTGAEVDSHRLLVRAGYIRHVAPGIYTWLPLGLRVLRRVEVIVREEMGRVGTQEVHFSALLSAEPYKAAKRWKEYGPTLLTLIDRKQGDHLLTPTHEEIFALLVKDVYFSYKDPPTMLYQTQTKYHDEVRPHAGLIRGRELIMKDAYSSDLTDEGFNASYNVERDTYERVFARLGLDYVIVSAMSGAMGGSRSEGFLHPSPTGEDTFVRSPGGYAASAEAVTTPAPEPVDAFRVGEPRVVAAPEYPITKTLVELLNSEYSRDDGRPWDDVDTLKSVVVTLTHPDGAGELLVVGIPDDHQIDMRRLGALLAPAEVEIAIDKELEDHPELVRDYISPQTIGPSSPAYTIDEGGRMSGSVRYLVGPRIIKGMGWATGANKDRHHAFNLVIGRDFRIDSTIEAAEVRKGGLAPDGSGPLHLERGVEIGHIFILGRECAKALGLTVLDESGKTQIVTMGSYKIDVSRVLTALAETNYSDRGLAWPAIIAPFDVHILTTGKDNEVFETARAPSRELEARGLGVLFDDRRKVSTGMKFADSELLGVPLSLAVGRGLATDLVGVRERASGERRRFVIEETVEVLVAAHEQLIKGE